MNDNIDIFMDIIRANKHLLRNYKEDNYRGVINFSCPLCGDSKKDQSKSRGYIYKTKRKLNYKCHNCGESMSLYNFIKVVVPESMAQLHKELYGAKNKNNTKPIPKFNNVIRTNKNIESELKPLQNILDDFKKISELDSNNEAVKYLNSRKIPTKFYNLLYYCEDINLLTSKVDKYKHKNYPQQSSILIPHYTKNGLLFAVQNRLLSGKFRYLTLQFGEHDKVYGLERIDKSKDIYVTEGAFDSMFVDNCLAMSGSSLSSYSDYIYIFDNDFNNKEIQRILLRIINKNHKVVIWGNKVNNVKDINDMILADLFIDKQELMNYIKTHTYSGSEAVIKFNQKYNKGN